MTHIQKDSRLERNKIDRNPGDLPGSVLARHLRKGKLSRGRNGLWPLTRDSQTALAIS